MMALADALTTRPLPKQYILIDFFFITITSRDITKQTDQYLSQKNKEFNDLNKAVMETLYFCFLRYFSER